MLFCCGHGLGSRVLSALHFFVGRLHLRKRTLVGGGFAIYGAGVTTVVGDPLYNTPCVVIKICVP